MSIMGGNCKRRNILTTLGLPVHHYIHTLFQVACKFRSTLRECAVDMRLLLGIQNHVSLLLICGASREPGCHCAIFQGIFTTVALPDEILLT